MNAQFDVIVVGTGAAGLFAALNLPENLRILMVTKDEMENSNSYLAQGGICVLKEQTDFDDFFNDTMKAGKFENNEESVRIMIEDSPQIIEQLIRYGVEFDRLEDGSLSYTKEGAHSTNRILHHKDITGQEITQKLIRQAKQRSNIEIRTFTSMVDLVMENNRAEGVILRDRDGKLQQVSAKAVVLATGGLGGLFGHSTNFRHITGDSFAIAAKHNIELENLNYVQIHPTSLYSRKPGRGFLISESVRGEGAILLNKDGERFVDELLPRDVVSAAIRKEMERTGMEYVQLSLVGKPKEWIRKRFPNIYKRCLEEGYDLTEEPIPVTPAQHYLMGGIKTGTRGETSAENLYAVGETGCNGVHGANRLASNSLLESLVFAKRAAAKIADGIDEIDFSDREVPLEEYENAQEWAEESRKLVMEEIKRKDRAFYDKWCNHASEH